jgi:hypothetical protein
MSEEQKQCLDVFARHGGYLLPNDANAKAVCGTLCKMKFFRPQPMLDKSSLKNGNATIDVAYQITAAGRKAWRKLEGARIA